MHYFPWCKELKGIDYTSNFFFNGVYSSLEYFHEFLERFSVCQPAPDS